jgi:hypothetical protein
MSEDNHTTRPGRLAAWCRALRPHHGIALVLFLGMVLVYNNSVPGGFNTVYENRRFFDSDGEFITRQFNQGKTFTHNDHLLYHVLGRLLYDHADRVPFVARNPVSAHKALSVVAGALGITLLFLFGRRITGRSFPALAAALWIGGCSGYWFFSATIDTYLPNLCAGILALGLALRCLRDQRLSSYALLGAAMGLAFLLRTDSFLLGSLILVVVAGPRDRIPARLAVCAAAGALISLAGYGWLAHTFYSVPPADLVAWALGHVNRPEAAKEWGVLSNLSLSSLHLAALNQSLYGVILPGLYHVRSLQVITVMGTIKTGGPVLWTYLAFMVLVLGVALAGAGRALKRRIWPPAVMMALAILWFLSRACFYAWWDPKDPFLFAVLSLPALWLPLLLFMESGHKEGFRVQGPGDGVSMIRRNGPACLVFLMAILIWIHNLLAMVIPLRAL